MNLIQDEQFLRLTLKKLYSIIHIPKFEAIQTALPSDEQSSTDFCETLELKWQQKIFSKTEFSYYAQRENCKSDVEKKYHQVIKEMPEDHKCGIIFTYVDDDNYVPNDNFGSELKTTKLRQNVDEQHERMDENSNGLFIDQKNSINASRYQIGNDEFTRMFVMADLEPTILLFIIKYRKSDGQFIMYPDFNSSINSYHLEIDQNSKQMYTYFMENLSKTSDEASKSLKQKQQLEELQDESSELIKKIIGMSIKDENFFAPKYCRIVLMMEIVSGVNFEYDNVHVQFKINLPKCVKVIDGILEAATHSSFRNGTVFNFGYCHCLVLDIDDEFLMSANELDTIIINFDVISIDPLWSRQRREGLASFRFPLECTKSIREVNLTCFRELQGNRWLIDFIERFFLGGLRSVKFFDGAHNFYGNSTVTTGNLKIKIQQIRQINSQNSYRNNTRMQSIDEIINCYHRAKAKLN